MGEEKNCGNCRKSLAYSLGVDEFIKAGIKPDDRLCSSTNIKIVDLKKSRDGCWRSFSDPFKDMKDPFNLGSIF